MNFKLFIILFLLIFILLFIYSLKIKENFQVMHKYIYKVNMKNSPNIHNVSSKKNIIIHKSETELPDYGVKKNIKKMYYHDFYYTDKLNCVI